MLRLGACLGVRLHIIHPTGFHFSPSVLRRSGLDYLPHADFLEHDSFEQFQAWRRSADRRLLLLTTAAPRSAYDVAYLTDDILMLGRESAGVPDAVSATADVGIRIPMRPNMRSLNVATAAALVLGEALRQTSGFSALS